MTGSPLRPYVLHYFTVLLCNEFNYNKPHAFGHAIDHLIRTLSNKEAAPNK